MYCCNCGTEIAEEDALFCPECGQAVEEPSAPIITADPDVALDVLPQMPVESAMYDSLDDASQQAFAVGVPFPQEGIYQNPTDQVPFQQDVLERCTSARYLPDQPSVADATMSSDATDDAVGYCWNCGAGIPGEDALFCPECGEAVQRTALPADGVEDGALSDEISSAQPDASDQPADAGTISPPKKNRYYRKVLYPILAVIAVAAAICIPLFRISTAAQARLTADIQEYKGRAPWGFYRAKLSTNQQAFYDAVYRGLEQDKTTINIPSLSKDEAKTVYYALQEDHPEYFWVDWKKTHYDFGKYNSGTFSVSWNMDTATRDATRKQIEAKADAFIAGIDSDASTYAKVKAAYEYVILNTSYDTSKSGANIRNLRGVFIDESAVCVGYADAFEYLTNRMGISCTSVTGDITKHTDSENTGHAWNIVTIDGVNTYVDPTWGDPSDTDYAKNAVDANIYYTYLCVTEDEISRTRTFAHRELLPKCDNSTYDYYGREGAYFKSYDAEAVKTNLVNRMRRGEDPVDVKFSTQASFDAACKDLLEEHALIGRMRSSGLNAGFQYSKNNDLYTLTFYLTY